MPEIEKICILYIYREYLLCLQSNASRNFFAKMYISFEEQQLIFSQLEGIMIPSLCLITTQRYYFVPNIYNF